MASQTKIEYTPPLHAAHITKRDIQEGLARLGMRRGDHVLVHSSLRRFGYVDGGADGVINALLDTVGADGTLLMSAITTNRAFVTRCIEAADAGVALDTPPLDVVNAKSWAGTIPETFRRRPGVRHSLHPTHAVTAIGARAAELIADHQNAPGPCGEGTPYTRLGDSERGFILLLGVNHMSNTALHGVEELAGVEYALYPKWCRIPILTPDGPAEARTRVHMPFIARRLGALETEYIDGRAQTVTQIGDSVARLIQVAAMREITLAALRQNPFALLAEPGMCAWRLMQERGVYTQNPLAPPPA